MKRMSDYQMEILRYRLTELVIDSSVVLPDCCREHKIHSWMQVQWNWFDIKDDFEFGKDVAAYQCLN